MKRITDDVRHDVIRRYESGSTAEAIAQDLKIHYSTCYRILKVAGKQTRGAARWKTVLSEIDAGSRVCRDCGERKPNADLIQRKGKPLALCRECHSESHGHVRRKAPPLNLSDAQLGYLAGLIDGEGCFHAVRVEGSYVIKVSISNTAEQFAETQAEYGFGSISVTRRLVPHWKDCYRWNIHSTTCRVLLPMLLPHLRIKRKNAELAIECLGLAKYRQSLNGKHSAEANEERSRLHARQKAIYLEMRRLNHRGPAAE